MGQQGKMGRLFNSFIKKDMSSMNKRLRHSTKKIEAAAAAAAALYLDAKKSAHEERHTTKNPFLT